MAKQKSTTIRNSIISTLDSRRTTIISAADIEGRDNTDAEHFQIAGLDTAIAVSTARNVADAAIQVRVALDQICVACEGVGSIEGLEMARAALRSARDVLAKAA